MALRFVAILGSLLVLATIHASGEGNEAEDTQVQNSFLDEVENADVPEALIKSSSLGNAGNGNRKPKNNVRRKKAKSKKRAKKQKQNKKKSGKKKLKKKKSQKGKRKNGKKSIKKKKKSKAKARKRKKQSKKRRKVKKGKKGKKRNVKKGKKGKRRKVKKGSRKASKGKSKKCTSKGCKKKRKNNKKKSKKKHNKKSRKTGKRQFKAAVCEDCVVKLANYAKLYVAQAKNRKQQILRMEAACKTSKKKVAKKELFDKPYKMLLDNAGGNKSDPKCKGKSIGKAIGSISSSGGADATATTVMTGGGTTGGNAAVVTSGGNSAIATTIVIGGVSVSIESNSSTSTRSQQDKEGDDSVTDMTTLAACNASIGTKCNVCQLDNPKKAKEADACKKSMIDFIKKMDNCLNVTKYANQKDLCNCVDGIDNANKTLENQIRECKWVTAASLKEVANKKKCVGEFSKCRKAEDAAVGHLHKCKLPLLKCGGVTTVDQAKKDLPVLKNLKTELDATETKMKSGFTNNGLPALNTSSDSKTPSGLNNFIKNPSGGSRAITKCRQLAQAYLKFNESAKGTGETANSDLNGTEASTTTDLLKVMKERNFTEEVLDCKTGTDKALLPINRFYGATMILWRTKVIDVKIVVLSLVISNAAKEEATTAVSGATAAATAAPASGDTTAAATEGDTTAAADTTVAAATTTAAAAETTAAGVSTAKAQGRKKRFMDTMQWLKQKVLKN